MIALIGALLLVWGAFDLVVGAGQITLGLLLWVAGIIGLLRGR